MTSKKATEKGIMEHESLDHALIAVQAETKAVVKDANNPHFKSTYATLLKVRETVLPILSKHGILARQNSVYDESGRYILQLDLILVAKGERTTSVMPLPTEGDPKAIGSALSYARRYTLMTACGLVATDEASDDQGVDDDDDGNSAATITPSGPAPKAAAPSTQTDYADGQRIKEAMWKESTVEGVKKVFSENKKSIQAMQDKSRNQITARRDQRIREIKEISRHLFEAA